MDVNQLILELQRDLAALPDKVAKGMDAMARRTDLQVAATPADVVYTEDKMTLLHYRPTVADGSRHPVPVLIVYALINRFIMLDLEPGRSFVQNLLDAGLDVYLIDWGRPTAADRFLDLGDYINGYLDNAVQQVRTRTGAPGINLMGVCMGGTFGVIYTALHPDKVKNLVALATPTDFDVDSALLFQWAKQFDVDKIVAALGNLPGDLANYLYLLVTPVDTVAKYLRLVNGLDNPRFVDTFLRMEKWIFDSPDMAAEAFRQYIRDLVQQNRLIRNRFRLEGRRVDLGRIRCPVLNVYGRNDTLAPAASARPLGDCVGSQDVTTLGVDTGHVGIFVGSTSRRTICPKITDWIRAR